MSHKNNSLKLKYILLLPLFISVNYILSFYPSTVESIFTRGFNKPILQLLSSITGIFSFSIGEIILISFVIFLTIYLVVFIKNLFKKQNKFYLLKDFIAKVLLIITGIYVLFLLLWGFNYQRLPLSTIVDLNVEPADISDLEGLNRDLIERTNSLRSLVLEDDNGVMYIEDGVDGIISRAKDGFNRISKTIPQLDGKFGKPKKIFFSKALTYTGIAGIYFPFTGEANINTNIPLLTLPSTIIHEMAHQRGFAREDEANYIAYLACISHPNIDFQYSGTLLALIHSMNELFKYDKEKYFELQQQYSDGVKRDLKYISKFWKSYEGPVERNFSEMNNAYLKSNLQRDGVYSYGRMVDLLMAEYKKKI